MSVSAVKRFVKEFVVRSMEEDLNPAPKTSVAVRPVPSTPLRHDPGPWNGSESPGHFAAGHGHRAPAPPPEPRAWSDREQPRRRKEEKEEYVFPIGFYANQVPAEGEVDIEVRPQIHFRGEQLVIPSDIAKAFDVVDVKIGKNSQTLTSGRIPGTVFDSRANTPHLKLSVAHAGITITIRVANLTQAPRDFRAALFGTVEET